jgi:site-specific recombinase XerC
MDSKAAIVRRSLTYCASVSQNVRCVSVNMRLTPASVSDNLRRKDHLLRVCHISIGGRYSYALINDGVDVRLVQEFLGHVSITSTAVYTAISPKRLAGVRAWSPTSTRTLAAPTTTLKQLFIGRP